MIVGVGVGDGSSVFLGDSGVNVCDEGLSTRDISQLIEANNSTIPNR
jgi:hypothetical protein